MYYDEQNRTQHTLTATHTHMYARTNAHVYAHIYERDDSVGIPDSVGACMYERRAHNKLCPAEVRKMRRLGGWAVTAQTVALENGYSAVGGGCRTPVHTAPIGCGLLLRTTPVHAGLC